MKGEFIENLPQLSDTHINLPVINNDEIATTLDDVLNKLI